MHTSFLDECTLGIKDKIIMRGTHQRARILAMIMAIAWMKLIILKYMLSAPYFFWNQSNLSGVETMEIGNT
jgi:hypothetical protein